MSHCFMTAIKVIWSWRSYLIAITAPVVLSTLFLYDGTEYEKQARCTFVLLMLVVFWTTECLPLAITALLPMFLYPLLKIATAKELAPKYMNEVIMAFMGSYIMVIAFEAANLHQRLALRILKTVGPQPRWLLFGIMMSACFLSMFTNNTVSCALHLPIVKGIIDELRKASKKHAAGEKSSDYELKEPAKNTASVFVVESTSSLSTQETFVVDTGIIDSSNSELSEKTSSVVSTVVESANESGVVSTDDGVDDETDNALSSKTITGLEKMLLIAAAYSSSIGGMCTLIGTPTNLIMKERVEEVFQAYNCTTHPVTFSSWLAIGLPVGYLFIFLAWFWLQFFFLGPKYVYRVWLLQPFRVFFRLEKGPLSRSALKAQRQAERVTAVINQLHAKLEPMGFQQYAVLAHCILLVVLLITRQMSSGDSHDYVGWGIIAPEFVEESTASILVTTSMFIFPSRWPTNWRKAPPPLLRWEQVEETFPFGVILLLGGGMAATTGAQESGLPLVIAPVFHNIVKELPLSFTVLITSIFIAGMTEVMSNVACVTLMSPVMEELAFELHVNPLLFLFPTTLSASFAFMLPVATLPNALVFSTNRLKIKDMVLCGMGMNLIGILVVFGAVTTWGASYFSLFMPPCSH